MSNSFSELYDILSKILSPDKLELIIEESKKTSLNDFNLHAWKQKEMKDLVINKRNRISRKEGIQYEKNETIKNMLKENISYELISKIVKKTIDEIKEIEKSMKD